MSALIQQELLDFLAELSTLNEAVAHGVVTVLIMLVSFFEPDTDRILTIATSIIEGLG
jgi:hypothetical protein